MERQREAKTKQNHENSSGTATVWTTEGLTKVSSSKLWDIWGWVNSNGRSEKRQAFSTKRIWNMHVDRPIRLKHKRVYTHPKTDQSPPIHTQKKKNTEKPPRGKSDGDIKCLKSNYVSPPYVLQTKLNQSKQSENTFSTAVTCFEWK